MPIKEVSITGRNNTRALVTGQEELLVKVNSFTPGATLPVTIAGPLGQAAMAASVPVVLASNQAGVQRTPSFSRPSTASPGTGTVALGAYSVSFASVGTANALVGGMVLKPGETLNFDAGAINNTLAAITYDVTTNSGAELIIIKIV